MSQEHFVIIGNGVAANSAAETLRQGHETARITLISDEFFPFFHRHLLSDYLIGKIERDDLIAKPLDYYKENKIRLRLGQSVVKVDFDNKLLFLGHMEKVHYTRLLICTGGSARLPDIYHPFRELFSVMKSFRDAQRWRKLLPRIETVVVVGGDLISVRLAPLLLSQGKRVVFLMDRECLWPLPQTPELLDEFADSLTKRGVEVIRGDTLDSITKNGEHDFAVKTGKGLTIPCQIVGGFFGLTPDVEFLFGSGLDIDRGILVNEFLQTEYPGVFAAGDCAQVYNPSLKNYWVSIGWHNAKHLGIIGADNLLGSQEEVAEPPLNVLECQDLTVRATWWRQL